ncbi:MAG: D-arabinose 5-phosphate isomerase [Legionellales bacterium RIFCSPHIGHO2_12_FULL_35_11]|nr:MAG: D-arabinose 5-phosphate isomerase [Legionellales bacterium RIFCSPHIGHO2_12_FULL_35_11]
MDFCALGLAVIETEAQAVFELTKKIDGSFTKACAILLNCTGRVVVTGMGKSGHIANKIAATFASTGTPAFFMHPGEASHGDLGMITKHDVVVALSNSGQTKELLILLPIIKRLSVPLISLSGNQDSPLALASDVNLDVSIKQEACPLGLAPTTSTTCALVMGDALAIALLEARGFSAEDFAKSHPGGTLGRNLLYKVDDIYHKNDSFPVVEENISVYDALAEVNDKKLGMTCVVNGYGNLTGIFTDGDIRRSITNGLDLHTIKISEVMSSNCKTIKSGKLAAEALFMMQEYSITSLVIKDDNDLKPIGVIHLHDLLRAGVY